MALALRERRRKDTIRLIQQAALRLASQKGHEAVTVEAICAEAGVSRRTFFNYFPVREAAFVVGPPPFPAEAVERFLSREGPFLEDLIALLQTRLPASGDERRALCMAMDLAALEPRMAAMQISASHTHEVELAQLIAQRIAAGPADLTPRLVAAAALATTRAVISQWATGEDTVGVRERLRDGLRSVRAVLSA
jgi:AcrR family transcriptional regulator